MGRLFLGGGGSYSGPPSRTTEEGEETFKSAVEEANMRAYPKNKGYSLVMRGSMAKIIAEWRRC